MEVYAQYVKTVDRCNSRLLKHWVMFWFCIVSMIAAVTFMSMSVIAPGLKTPLIIFEYGLGFILLMRLILKTKPRSRALRDHLEKEPRCLAERYDNLFVDYIERIIRYNSERYDLLNKSFDSLYGTIDPLGSYDSSFPLTEKVKYKLLSKMIAILLPFVKERKSLMEMLNQYDQVIKVLLEHDCDISEINGFLIKPVNLPIETLESLETFVDNGKKDFEQAQSMSFSEQKKLCQRYFGFKPTKKL